MEATVPKYTHISLTTYLITIRHILLKRMHQKVLSPCFVSNYMTVVHDTFEIYGSMLYVKNQWFFQLHHQKNRPPMEMEKKESMSTYLCWRDFIVENARPTIFSIFLQNRNQIFFCILSPLIFVSFL